MTYGRPLVSVSDEPEAFAWPDAWRSHKLGSQYIVKVKRARIAETMKRASITAIQLVKRITQTKNRVRVSYAIELVKEENSPVPMRRVLKTDKLSNRRKFGHKPAKKSLQPQQQL